MIDKGIKGIIQDALFMDSMGASGVASLGEDTFENVMEYSIGEQVENDKKISEVRKEFLDYIYEEWKKDE